MHAMLRRRSLAGILTTAAGIVVATSAGALEKKPDFTIIQPSTSGGRYLTVHEAENLQQWRYNVGFYLNYARKPIQLRNIVTNQRFDIVRDVVTADMVGAVGFTDWFQAGLALPVTLYEAFFDPNQQRTTGGAAPQETKAGLGDLRIETKFRLLDIDRYKFGVAVVPYFIFPTGRTGSFISNEAFTGGGKVAGEVNIKDRAWVGVNVGYQYVRRQNQYFVGNADALYDDLLSFGIGTRVRLTKDWSLLGEGLAETNLKSAFTAVTQTPVLVMAGAQWTPQQWSTWRGLNVTLMGGAGVTRGVGSPQAQVLLGVNYRKPKIVSLGIPEGSVVEAKVEEKIIITQKIHFEFNRAVVRPISYPILDDVAELLQRNPQIRRVQVEGHTDWIGSDAYNQRLSQRRAEVVVDYLTRKGVDRNRLVPVGYGESRPVADNNATAGRAQNRRTEFTVVE